MSFFKKLFSSKPKEYVDERGIYYYVECHKCHKVMRVRIDRSYDLNREEDGYSWRKTLVCDNCFHKMETEMTFDSKYNQRTQEITGGKYVAEPVETETADDADSAAGNGERGFG